MARRFLLLLTLTESTIAVIPILRSVFECGVMAQWVRWVPGSDAALMEETRGQLEAMNKYLSRSTASHIRDEAARTRSDHADLAENWPDLSERAHSARFAAICDAFYGGADLYSRYKYMSAHTHAGIEVAGAWLLLDDDGPGVGRPLLKKPRERWTVKDVAYIGLQALGWSSRAFDDLVAESPRSDFLDSVEQRTQVSTWLQIRA
jgi:hypothetical protein